MLASTLHVSNNPPLPCQCVPMFPQNESQEKTASTQDCDYRLASQGSFCFTVAAQLNIGTLRRFIFALSVGVPPENRNRE